MHANEPSVSPSRNPETPSISVSAGIFGDMLILCSLALEALRDRIVSGKRGMMRVVDEQDRFVDDVIEQEWRCTECAYAWTGDVPVHAPSCVTGRVIELTGALARNLNATLLSHNERSSASSGPADGAVAESPRPPHPEFGEPWSVVAPDGYLPGIRCVMDSAGQVIFDFKHSNLCAAQQSAIARYLVWCVNSAASLRDISIEHLCGPEYLEWLGEMRLGKIDTAQPQGGAE